jgi:poly(hydroxyalkanoate) granule-associated protein
MGQRLKHAPDDRKLTELMANSAHQIWLAGLGAFAKAQSERTKLFDSLVKRGEAMQACAGKAASEHVTQVGKSAAGAWDKLEQVFEERVSHALNRLGVPSYQDIQTLSKHVAELNASVQTLLKPGKGSAAAAKKPAVRARKTSPMTSSVA